MIDGLIYDFRDAMSDSDNAMSYSDKWSKRAIQAMGQLIESERGFAQQKRVIWRLRAYVNILVAISLIQAALVVFFGRR